MTIRGRARRAARALAAAAAAAAILTGGAQAGRDRPLAGGAARDDNRKRGSTRAEGGSSCRGSRTAAATRRAGCGSATTAPRSSRTARAQRDLRGELHRPAHRAQHDLRRDERLPTRLRNGRSDKALRDGIAFLGGQAAGRGVAVVSGNVIRGNRGAALAGSRMTMTVDARRNDLRGNARGAYSNVKRKRHHSRP